MIKIDGVSCYGSAYENQNYHVTFEHDNGYNERVCEIGVRLYLAECVIRAGDLSDRREHNSLIGWDRVVPFLKKYFKVVGKIVEISAI